MAAFGPVLGFLLGAYLLSFHMDSFSGTIISIGESSDHSHVIYMAIHLCIFITVLKKATKLLGMFLTAMYLSSHVYFILIEFRLGFSIKISSMLFQIPVTTVGSACGGVASYCVGSSSYWSPFPSSRFQKCWSEKRRKSDWWRRPRLRAEHPRPKHRPSPKQK